MNRPASESLAGPLRVLAFSDFAWPEGSGGVERCLAEIYPRLVEAGTAAVELITLSNGTAPRAESRDGVRITRLPRVPLDRLLGMQVTVSAAVWPESLRAARRFRPNLIHAHTLFFHTSIVAAVLSFWLKVPLLLTLHLGAADALPQPYRALTQIYERTLGRLLLKRGARIICVSDDVVAHAITLGASREKVVMIPNGVNLAQFAPPDGDRELPEDRNLPTVTCVGRLIMNKGQHFLLDAASEARDRGFRFRLLFVGDGPMESRLRDQTRALNLNDTVEFLGHRDDVPWLLSQSDIFVRPSLTEGMSLAVLEGLAAGLPVIATDVSGTAQMIEDGRNGFIVRPGSVADLSAALTRLLASTELRRSIGRAARLRAADFDWSSVARETGREMIRARRLPRPQTYA